MSPSAPATVPPLSQRILLPLVVLYVVGATRLGLDFADRQSAMWIGQYYAIPFLFAWIGFRRAWGPIGWPALALTMPVLCIATFGVWTSIAYTTGQFLEWTDARYFPGTPVFDEAGEIVSWNDGRALPLASTTLGKVGSGLLHGAITSFASTLWSTFWGTLLIWLPARVGRRAAVSAAT